MADPWYITLAWTISGAAIGAGLSIILSKRDDDRRKRELLTSAAKELTDALKFNDDRVVQALSYFGKCMRPNYEFDTPRITFWLVLSSDLLSRDLSKEIDWHRYQLDNINRKLDLFHTYVITSRACQGGRDAFRACDTEEGQEYLDDLCDHLEAVHKGVGILIQRLEEEAPQ